MRSEPTLEFWKNMALGLKDELVERGNEIAELEAQLASLWQPVEYLEVDHDDPMHVRHGVVWYKDWDSSEWLTLFPEGHAVCKLMPAQHGTPLPTGRG